MFNMAARPRTYCNDVHKEEKDERGEAFAPLLDPDAFFSCVQALVKYRGRDIAGVASSNQTETTSKDTEPKNQKAIFQPFSRKKSMTFIATNLSTNGFYNELQIVHNLSCALSAFVAKAILH